MGGAYSSAMVNYRHDCDNYYYVKPKMNDIRLVSYKTFAMIIRKAKREFPTCVLKYIYEYVLLWKYKLIFDKSIEMMDNPDDVQRLLPYYDGEVIFNRYDGCLEKFRNGFLHHYHRAVGINREKIVHSAYDKHSNINGHIYYDHYK